MTTINRHLIDGSKRQGEMWLGSWGFFWRTLYGVELPNGQFVGVVRYNSWEKR